MSVLKADYFDGKSSLKRPVSVMVTGNKLKVVGRDVDEEFDARGVRRSLRIAGTPRCRAAGPASRPTTRPSTG